MVEKFNPKIHEDRRGKSQFWTYVIRTFGILGWICFLIAIALLDKARPETEKFLDRYFYQKMNIPINIRTEWDDNLLGYLIIVMFIVLVLSIVGLIINKTLHRRRDDYYRFYLVTLTILSSISILMYYFL